MAPDDRSNLITVELFGGLDERVPAPAGGRLELSAATLRSAGELLAAAGLPPDVTGLVFVNGPHAGPATAVTAFCYTRAMSPGNIPRLIEMLRSRSGDEKQLPCTEAFKIARDLEIPVAEVGKTCDELGIKVVACQLGCF